MFGSLEAVDPNLDGGQGGHDGRRAKAMSDEREVGQVSLNRRFQNLLRSGVAQGRPVLVEQVHQLLGDESKEEGDRL